MMTGDEVLHRVRELEFPAGKYVVVGGGVLAVHGLRETDDIDIVVLPTLFTELATMGWAEDPAYEAKWGHKRLVEDDIEIHEQMMFLNREGGVISAQSVIDSADHIEGLPFQNLKSLLRFKKNALREKDVKDVAMLEQKLGVLLTEKE